jgi:MFS family permease
MSAPTNAPGALPTDLTHQQKQLLFWGCFIALIATAFGFIVRALLMTTWGAEFNLNPTQQGEIFGVGLWPFAISIILFSLIIDKIGYGRAMVFAFVCHVASAVLTITATGYWSLWIAMFIVALANGAVEAVINPVVATLYPKEKTKWLNILHAGWPGGLVLGGLLVIGMGAADWKLKVGLLLVPTVIYGLILARCRFPVNERVAAGVPYRDMLKEFGVIGAFISSWLVSSELFKVVISQLLRLENAPSPYVLGLVVAIAVSLAFGFYVRFALGRPLFIVMLFIMIPLAITELGTDSWISALMEPQMVQLGMAAGWVLVYTSFIMMVLRFCAGPIVHKLSPLGLLAASAAIALVGLVFLSKATGAAILLAATLYGVGKTFFWPTMLGVVAEQSPRGGALTLNAIAGVGMLGVGIIGTALLGYIQDTSVDRHLLTQRPEIHQQVRTEKQWVLGSYPTLDEQRVQQLPEAEQSAITEISNEAKKDALTTVAIFPGIMLLAYLGLIFYFRRRGGYRPQMLTEADSDEKKYTGGVEAPVEA